MTLYGLIGLGNVELWFVSRVSVQNSPSLKWKVENVILSVIAVLIKNLMMNRVVTLKWQFMVYPTLKATES